MKKYLYALIFFFNLLNGFCQQQELQNHTNTLLLNKIKNNYHKYFFKQRNDTILWNNIVESCESLIKNDTFIYKAIGLHYKGLIYMHKDTAIARALFFESIKVNPEIFDNYFKISVLDEQLYGYGRAANQRVKI